MSLSGSHCGGQTPPAGNLHRTGRLDYREGMDTVVGRPADTVRAEELDDELTLFDTRTGTAVALNRTAADILALADGESTVAELVTTLARTYAVEPSAIADEVLQVVHDLTAAGILIADDA